MSYAEDRFDFVEGDDINDKARKLAEEYNLPTDLVIRLEMDFVAFADGWSKRVLSRLLQQIEELTEVCDICADAVWKECGCEVDGKNRGLKAVKALIKEELKR